MTAIQTRQIDVEALRFGVSLLGLLPPDAKPRRNGKDQYVARCSFHEDDRPSMSVRLSRIGWTYNCFACGERGDVIKYVMKTQRIDFGAAVRAMADGRAEFLQSGPYTRRARGFLIVCTTCGGRKVLDVETRDEAVRAAVFAGWQVLDGLTRCDWCLDEVLMWRERLSLDRRAA